MARVVVLLPPVSVARDFIDYPYFADLGAVQMAAALRAGLYDVDLVDAYALPGSGLSWRPDGRAHMGASVAEVAERCHVSVRDADATVVALTPFHRPPTRDDVLAGLLAELAAIAPRAPILLADLYQSGQHYVESEEALASYPEARAWLKYEGEVALPRLLAGRSVSSLPRGVLRGEDVPRLDELPLPAWDLVDLAAHDAFRRGKAARELRARGVGVPRSTVARCPS